MRAVIIGFGKMGQAMCQAWQEQSYFDHLTVIDPCLNDMPVDQAVSYCHSITDLPSDAAFDLVIFAVKPQIMPNVLESWCEMYQGTAPLYLSIAAGKKISFFETYLGPDQKIIRVMPNTPAAIGKGASVLCANMYVTRDEKEKMASLLAAVGQSHWIEDEGLMDAVTAVSGSGPAYVFLLIEEMAKAGVKAGLDEELAMALARQTVIGSAALAEAEDAQPASTLRENVTSPGGTTAAALEVLMREDAMPNIITEAILAARDRGRALS